MLNDATKRRRSASWRSMARPCDEALLTFRPSRRAHTSAFASDTVSVLAHLDCDEKSNENPGGPDFARLACAGRLWWVTVDAMHGRYLSARRYRRSSDRSGQSQPTCSTSRDRRALRLPQHRSIAPKPPTRSRCRDETRCGTTEVFAPGGSLASTPSDGQSVRSSAPTATTTRSATTGLRRYQRSLCFVSDVASRSMCCCGHWHIGEFAPLRP